MTPDLGVLSDLLENIGRLSGQPVGVWDGQERSLPAGSRGAALRLLQQESVRTDAPVALGPEKGGVLCGVSVNTAAPGPCVLYAWLPDGANGNGELRTNVMRLLGDCRRLAAERQQTIEENGALTTELGQAYEDLHLYARISTQIRTLQFSGQMLRGLIEEMRETMRVDLAAAMFEQPAYGNVKVTSPDIRNVLPAPDGLLEALRTDMARSAPAFDEGGFIINCSTDIPAFAALHASPYRALAVRIQSGERIYGWLLFVSFNMREIFRRGEYRLLRMMAEQVGLVMANSEMFNDLEQFALNLVKSMAMALEAKDAYTNGHSERVSAYSMRIGKALALDERQLQNLLWASLLHDIGKIGTPETILNNPGRLTDSEYACIKEHPSRGATILAPIPQLAGALPGIRHHHERFDGKGYPDGLRGNDIPILGRIIAVADTYDAVTTNRAYRGARSSAEAMRIITGASGTQFDPRVVAAFAAVIGAGPGRTDKPAEAPTEMPRQAVTRESYAS